MSWIVLAQEPYVVPVLSALAGALGATLPSLLKWLKGKRQEDRADREANQRITAAEYERLLAELRTERTHLVTERQERENELKALRREHVECLERAARQDSRLNEFERTVQRLEAEVKDLRRRQVQKHDPPV